jgi:hypothetical protein
MPLALLAPLRDEVGVTSRPQNPRATSKRVKACLRQLTFKEEVLATSDVPSIT